MPLIVVRRNPAFLNEAYLKPLGDALIRSVIAHLDRGTTIKPEQVEVRFEVHGPHDLNTHPLEIMVFASESSHRIERLTEAVCGLRKDIQMWIREHNVAPQILLDNENFVQIVLAKSSFVKL